jgi:predicted Zn-dependent protease
MTYDERQFLLTAAWMFMRHGQPSRALALCEALSEDDPRDGVPAVALAELLLAGGNASRAIEVLMLADMPDSLAHVEAVLETRALAMSGRKGEAASRWRRYLESRKGSERRWVG